MHAKQFIASFAAALVTMSVGAQTTPIAGTNTASAGVSSLNGAKADLKPLALTQSGAGQARAPMPDPLPPKLPEIKLVDEAINRAAPMTPADVVEFRRLLQERTDAANQPLSNKAPAKPVSTVYTLDLSPGAAPGLVRVSLGDGAFVSFVDTQGDPWPIVGAQNFSEQNLTVTKIAPSTLSVSVKNAVGSGTVGVMLQGMSTGVSLKVVQAKDEFDYRVDVTIPRLLTGSANMLGAAQGEWSPGDQMLVDYLLKMAPKTSAKLAVTGSEEVLAWQTSPTRMVVRTRSLLLTPAFFKSRRSSDGTTVYEIPLTSAVTVDVDGVPRTVRIGGMSLSAGGAK